MKKLQSIFKKTLPWVIMGVLLGTGINYASANKQDTKELHTHHQVEIVNFKFVPEHLEVEAGDIVTWINKDVFPHNIMDRDTKETLSPDLALNESYSYKVDTNLDYLCGLHKSMQGGITVKLKPN